MAAPLGLTLMFPLKLTSPANRPVCEREPEGRERQRAREQQHQKVPGAQAGGGAAAAGGMWTGAFSAPQSIQLPSSSRRGWCEQLAHLAGSSTPARHGFPTSLIVVVDFPQASIFSWGVRTSLVERQLHCAGFARLCGRLPLGAQPPLLPSPRRGIPVPAPLKFTLPPAHASQVYIWTKGLACSHMDPAKTFVPDVLNKRPSNRRRHFYQATDVYDPPLPRAVVGPANGRVYPAESRERAWE